MASPLAFLVGATAIPQLWGYHAWTYLSTTYVAGILGVTCVAIFLIGRLRGKATDPVFCLAAGWGLGLALRDRSHLLGDGQLWLGVLRGSPTHHAHEPLAYGFLLVCTRALKALGIDTPALRAELVSIALGGVGVMLLYFLARRLDGGKRLPFLFCFLLSTATLQFGAGYVEAYPTLWIVFLLYALAGYDAAANTRSVLPAAFLAGLAFAVHGLGVAALVSLVGLLWGRPLRVWITAVILAAAAPAFAYGVLPRWLHASPAESVSILPQLTWYAHGLGPWILEQINRFGLTAPLAPGVLAWVAYHRRSALWSDPRVRFLGLLAVPCILPALVLDTEGSRGAAVDWDTFAAGAPVLSAWALAAALQLRPDFRPAGLRWALVPALAGSLAFVAVQSQPRAAAARARDLAENPLWSSGSKAMTYESLGLLYRSRGDTVQAAGAYQSAWRHTPGNTRLLRNAIGLLSRAGEARQAADLYGDLVDHGPVDSMTWVRYGLTLWDAGVPDSARWALETALNVEPQNGVAARELVRLLVTPPSTAEDTAKAQELMQRFRGSP